MRKESDTSLTAAERHELELVVGNARSMGWIGATDELAAVHSAGGIIVSARYASNHTHTKSYPNEERWLFELLRDLAHGMWREINT